MGIDIALPISPIWRDRCLSLIPAAIIFGSVIPLVTFLLPSTADLLTESYEPGKTIRFFATHGTTMHKWGPVPNFLFGPVYALYFSYLKVTGQLSNASSHFPYGLSCPSNQIGSMILWARIASLLVGAIAVYILARSLQKALNVPLAAFFGVMLCTTTSILLLESLVDTKPDGLMISLLMIGLGGYALIVLRGFTLARALMLSGFWVASLSCKELTGATMVIPFLCLLVLAVMRWKRDPNQAKYLLIAVLSPIVFYLALNVLYAPRAWMTRMVYVVGPLKDPGIWANASQTQASYAADTMQAIVTALGIGGIFAFAITIVGTIRFTSPRLLLLWLPFVSHLALTTLTAGYMPAYFMLPLAPALTLPSSYVFAQVLQRYHSRETRLQRILPLALGTGLLCLWSGCSATVLFRNTHRESLERAWASANIRPPDTLSVVSLVPTLTATTTLSNSGFLVDDRPLSALMESPIAARPNFLMIPYDFQNWIAGIRLRPARAALLWRLTGFDYRSFRSFEHLGYRHIADIEPELPVWCVPALVAGGGRYLQTRVFVYRRNSPSSH